MLRVRSSKDRLFFLCVHHRSPCVLAISLSRVRGRCSRTWRTRTTHMEDAEKSTRRMHVFSLREASHNAETVSAAVHVSTGASVARCGYVGLPGVPMTTSNDQNRVASNVFVSLMSGPVSANQMTGPWSLDLCKGSRMLAAATQDSNTRQRKTLLTKLVSETVKRTFEGASSLTFA